MSSRHVPDAGPHEDGHDGVVEHVEEADLAELLPQDEEESVKELDELAHVEPIADP